MFTLEAHCRSGHYLATIVPTVEGIEQTQYHVFVFQQGKEVYQGCERTVEQAVAIAQAYLDWQQQQDLSS
jgi:hypothetical protein